MRILDAAWYIGVMIFHIVGDSRRNKSRRLRSTHIVESCIGIVGFQVPVSENEYTSLVYILCPSQQPAGNSHVQLL